MYTSKKCASAIGAAAMCMLSAVATNCLAVQHQMSYRHDAADLGPAPGETQVDIAISFTPVHKEALESFVASTADPKNPNFRKFISTQQFAARFGQPDATVKRVASYLETQGFVVTQVFDNHLGMMVRGSNKRATLLFNTPIHTFMERGVQSQRPLMSAAIPAVLADVVNHVAGLNTTAVFKPHLQVVPDGLKPLTQPPPSPLAVESASAVKPAANLPANIPGQYTVNDFASLYNVSPLYNRGVTGAGRTLGIMTFASFTPAQVGTYWASVGLSSSTARIKTVNVIPGSTIGSSGADETTLDVEQSGGIARGAQIIVYEAPNTDAGALALFNVSINQNKADTMSISWGEAEIFYEPEDLVPYDALLLQAAAQGITITASAGDAGAYDINRDGYPYPNYSALLSVDYWASSPYVLAAGGTTLPVTLHMGTDTITVPAERPWAWDYLRDHIISTYGQAYYYAHGFPVGGGGGVSVKYALPDYQSGLIGVQPSAWGQSLFCFSSPTAASGNTTCTPGDDEWDLPGGFSGRNVPDVSLNADPYSGYALYYNNTYITGYGGTSFVAPQLNGVFALIGQLAGTRLGWIQPQLYQIFKAKGYAANSPFRQVSFGSNLYYTSSPSYNPASGLGSLDVNNLASSLLAK